MTMKETLHALEEVKQAIELAYSSGYSAGKQQRKWVGLTDEQKQCLVTDWFDEDWAVKKAFWLLDDYEAKLKDRNT